MVLARALLICLLSVVGSLALMLLAVPALGGTVDRLDLVLAVVCPTVIAFPPSLLGGLQRQKLARELKASNDRHSELVSAYDALGERARRDEMTGMLHRDAFLREVGDRIHEPGGALIVVDTDDFRSINERFGHQSGDDALLQISDALHRAAGKFDILGRISGEEFAVYVDDARRGEARELAERICEEVRRARLVSRDLQEIQISVSIGVALTGRGISMDGLLQSTERCRMDARRMGRNRVGYDCEMPLAA